MVSRSALLERLEADESLDDAELEELSKLLDFYKPTSKLDQLDKKATKQGKEIVKRMHDELGLDYLKGYKMYWNVQKTMTKSLLLLAIQSEVDEQELYHRVVSYYYQERISTLQVVAAIFRVSQDPNHGQVEKAKKLAANWIAAGLKEKCLRDFQDTLSAKLPSIYENYAEKAAFWTNQNLKEQQAFLEILIMLYYSNLASPQDSVAVFKALMSVHWGYKQSNRPFFDVQANTLYTQVQDLAAILAIEVLNFEEFFSRMYSSDRKIASEILILFDSPDAMKSLNQDIWEYFESHAQSFGQELTPAGLVALSWSCFIQFLQMVLSQNCPTEYNEFWSFLQRVNPEERSTQILFQYGYIKGGALDYLIRLLDPSMSFIQGDSNEIAYKSIVNGLLNVMSATQNISTLPNRSKLVKVYTSLFQSSPILVENFWTVDFKVTSSKSLLETTQRSFPVLFDDFINLVTSLIASEASADYCFQFLSSQFTFCDVIVNNSTYKPSFEQKNGMDIYYFQGEHNLVGNAPNLIVSPPNGTIAYEVGECASENGLDSQKLVLLNFEYSCWHLCLVYLDSFLHESRISVGIEDHGNVGTVETTICILKLFNQILRAADIEVLKKLFLHLAQVEGNYSAYGYSPKAILPGIVGDILNRCSTTKVPVASVISEALATIELLLPLFPSIIWNRLRGSNMFPQYAYEKTGSLGYFQTTILPMECASGTYSSTVSFLSLIKNLVVEGQKQDTSLDKDQANSSGALLYSCVLFVIKDIFSTYSSWRFVHVREKYQITLLVLEIFERIMEDETWYHLEVQRRSTPNSSNFNFGVSVIQLLLESYVYTTSNYQLSPLLDVISVGVKGPLLFFAAGKKREALLLEDCMVQGLKLLKRFLMVLTNYDHISGLESALLDRNTETPAGPVEFIQIIASLIDYQNNIKFAQLATENLTLLCILSKKPGRPPTFFVGYFGDEAFSLVSKFVDLVRTDGQRTTKTPSLQTAVYAFITAVVESQPGLGAMFLSGSEPKNSASKISAPTGQIPSSSILNPVLNVIKNWRSLKTAGASILDACCNLLDSLWQSSRDHQTTLKILREQDSLWNSLVEILLELKPVASLEDISNPSNYFYFISAQAHVVKLMSTEVYLQFRNPALIVNSDTNVKIVKSLSMVLFAREIPMGQEKLIHHPELTEQLLELCAAMQPPIALEGYRRITWDDSSDSERHYGDYFIYNVDLLQRKLGAGPEDADEMQIIGQAKLVNVDWSFTDVQIVLLKATGFSIKLFSSSEWKASGKSPISAKDAHHTISVLLANLRRNNTLHFVYLSYKEELASILFHLIDYWCSLQAADEAKCITQILSMLETILECINTAQFPLGPAGKISNFPYQFHLFSAMLLLLRKLSKLPKGDQKRINFVYKDIINTLCQALGFILSGHSNSEEEREESLVLALLFELTRLDCGAAVSTWIPFIEKYQTVPLLLNAFATWQADSKSNLCISPEKVLQLLLSFSSHSAFSNLLVANGVIAAFCNNTFSANLVDGIVSPYDGLEPSQCHAVWCLMMATISQLLHFLQGESYFLESVIGFVRLYQNQFVFALNGYREREVPITLGCLYEIELLVGLYYRLAESLDLRRARLSVAQACSLPEIPIMNEFQDQILSLLSLYVFLFKNPHELGSKIQTVSRSDKQLAETPLAGKKSHTFVSATTNSVYKNKIDFKMLSILQNIIGFLRIYSQVSSVLGDQGDLLKYPSLFTPTLNSFQEYGATFGNLFDLLRQLTGQLKKLHEKQGSQIVFKEVKNLAYACESIISLIAAQLRLIEKDEDLETIVELRNEFHSSIAELNQLFAEAVKSWRDLDYITEAKEFINIVGKVISK